MNSTRRDFLKIASIGGIATTILGFDLTPAYAQMRALKISRATETRSTCPYCSVSCGVIIYTLGDKAKNVTPQVVHVEGDPDHPINRGTLCPKGASLEQEIMNDRAAAQAAGAAARLEPIGRTFPGTRRSMRSPAISRRRATRPSSRPTRTAHTVNRCEAIAWTGGCTDTNELNYLVVKTMRSLGVCYIENQARV